MSDSRLQFDCSQVEGSLPTDSSLFGDALSTPQLPALPTLLELVYSEAKISGLDDFPGFICLAAQGSDAVACCERP